MNTAVKLDMLAIAAHPDDAELSCAGTLAKEAAQGKKTGILDLTRGELGTRGTPAIRDEEAAKAATILNLAVRENLGFKDGFFVSDESHQLEVIKVIRKYKPEIVLCNAVNDRHPDHARGSDLASVSCFLAGLRKIETVLDGEVQEAWRPKFVYHYIQWRDLTPDVAVDITDFMDVKIEAVASYSSQFHNPSSNEPVTPISNKNFLDSVRYRAANLGRLVGTDYAEGFNVERCPAVDSLFDLK